MPLSLSPFLLLSRCTTINFIYQQERDPFFVHFDIGDTSYSHFHPFFYFSFFYSSTLLFSLSPSFPRPPFNFLKNLLLHPASSAKEGNSNGLPVLKIADFGFARSLPHLSLAETLCGSPLYMAPEILRYEKYDAKADLWSVGAVLYEMCTGKPPFRAQNHVELLKRIEKAQDVITFPGDVDERSGSSGASPQTGHHFTPISDDIKNLIRQLLKRNPVERISFEEFFMNPTVSNLASQSRSRVSRRSVSVHETRSESPSIESKRSTLDPSRYIYESVPRDRNEKRPALIHTGLKDQSDKPLSPLHRSRPRSIQEGSPPTQDHRPPLQLPISSPSPHHAYIAPSQQNYNEPSSQPISTSRRIKSEDTTGSSPKSVSNQPSSQPYRRSTLVGIPDVSRRYSAPEDDALLDKDYVVVEKRTVELNVLADGKWISSASLFSGAWNKFH